jgi:hypothetical protein
MNQNVILELFFDEKKKLEDILYGDILKRVPCLLACWPLYVDI